MISLIIFAILNRARGSKLFDRTSSTTVARLVSTLGMALLAGIMAGSLGVILWAWPTLFIWSVPGWGKYVGAAIGQTIDPHEEEFMPVDWVMERLLIRNTRLWGAIALGLRMTLAAPCVVGVAYLTGGSPWWALVTPMLGLPYVLCGYAFGALGWAYGEYCSGALLGLAIYMAI